jgi:hypothetical protein
VLQNKSRSVPAASTRFSLAASVAMVSLLPGSTQLLETVLKAPKAAPYRVALSVERDGVITPPSFLI